MGPSLLAGRSHLVVATDGPDNLPRWGATPTSEEAQGLVAQKGHSYRLRLLGVDG